MREVLTTLLELTGLGAITVGAWQVFHPAGLIIGGVSAIVVGYLERPVEPIEPTE